jgi:hypothetical protein
MRLGRKGNHSNTLEKYYICNVTYITKVQWLRLALHKGPNRVGVSFPSPDGHKIQVPKLCFSSI